MRLLLLLLGLCAQCVPIAILPLHRGRTSAPHALLSGRLPVRGHTAPDATTSTFHDYFYVQLRIGTPWQSVNVILDTGSSMTYLPCARTCTNCGHHHDPYLNSSSLSPIACTHAMCSTSAGLQHTWCANEYVPARTRAHCRQCTHTGGSERDGIVGKGHEKVLLRSGEATPRHGRCHCFDRIVTPPRGSGRRTHPCKRWGKVQDSSLPPPRCSRRRYPPPPCTRYAFGPVNKWCWRLTAP